MLSARIVKLFPLAPNAPPSVIAEPCNVVTAPTVTGSLYVCAPLVVTLPPLISVLPNALVVRLAALSAPPTVVTPMLFNITAPKGTPLARPTEPANVIAPLPALIVKLFALVLIIFDAKFTGLFVVLNVVFPPSVTAPLYVCVPVVVIEPANINRLLPPIVKLLNGVIPPIIPDSCAVVGVLITKLEPPFTAIVEIPLLVEVNVVPAPNVMTFAYDCAPVVVMAPPLIALEPDTVVVRLANGVMPPIIPPKVVTFAEAVVNPNGPFTVFAKVIVPMLLDVSAVVTPNVTGSLYVCRPVVVVIPVVLIVVLPAASVVKLVNPLTIPLKVVIPAVFRFKPNPPPLMLAKLIAPAPLEVSVVFPPSVTASL